MALTLATNRNKLLLMQIAIQAITMGMTLCTVVSGELPIYLCILLFFLFSSREGGREGAAVGGIVMGLRAL